MEEGATKAVVKKRQKHSIGSESNEIIQPTKKVRLEFSGKEFRNQLKTAQKIEALQEFLRLINEDSKQDYILAYLDKGGNALEILQIMENDPTVSPVLIFEVVNKILLQINAKFHQHQKSAYDSCRYLLNNYITVINKMLGLSSSSKERVAVLKLLTTIVTVSVVLAKDILLHVSFNPSNLEILTKVTEGKNEVRNAFIHFIVAFLVDGHFPALSVLLEKKGLMTSIIDGLKYDKVEVVVLVLTVMKSHILENPAVSKTVKMKTFSTPVVKNIVNLYNWKGFVDQKKSNKVITVDEIDKSKVSDAVHAFLLVLCTSHKFGIIFKDQSMGFGKRHQNLLIYTVLDSLERPWEHSYASELVTKICRACPDLTKTMWMNMKPFLEPRLTDKWINAMKFAARLVDELQPECLEFCAKNLNAYQMAQTISTQVAPLGILKTITPENCTFDAAAVKYNIILLLLKMTKALENYLNWSKDWPNIDHQILRAALSNHLNRNFPDVQLILTDWDRIDNKADMESLTVSHYLHTALDLLEYYKVLSPKMLDDIGLIFDIEEFMLKTETIDDMNKLELRKLQVKAVKFFVDVEPALFSPKTDLFVIVVSYLIEFYYNCKDPIALYVLNRLLTNSGVFDTYLMEIDVWIDGVLNLKKYDKNIATFICDLIKKVDVNASKYNRQLLVDLGSANFGPLILTLETYFDENGPTKAIQTYLNCVVLNLFHLQVDSTAFSAAISKLSFLSDDLINYVEHWRNFEITPLKKCKGRVLDRFRQFSVDFLENHLEDFHCELYPNFKLNLLQASIFYMTNLIKTGMIKPNHVENCRNFVTYLFSQNVFEDDRYIQTILRNPLILHHLNLFDSDDFSTKFVVDFVKRLSTCKCNIRNYLDDFRYKIMSVISKVFKKPQKYEQSHISIEILETFNLDYEQCVELIEKFVNCRDNKRFYLVACYCLDRMTDLLKNDFDFEPLNNDVISELSNCLIALIEDQVSNLNYFSSSLLNYLKIFKHNLEGIKVELFDNLLTMTEFNKDNLLLCEFLLDRKPEFMASFEKHLDEICSRKSFLLALLDVVIKQNNETLLRKIFVLFENQIIKALEKPHKAGQHFHNHFHSVGVLIEKFMKSDKFSTQILKFETTELFHVYLLKKIYDKVEKNEKVVGNMIMTFVHLLTSLLKQKGSAKPVSNLEEISGIFFDLLWQTDKTFKLTFLSSNDSLKRFCKLCLKYGIAGDVILIRIVAKLLELCVTEEDARLILDMLLSHSQFLDVVLGDGNKSELLCLWQVLCIRWPQFMERNHVPVLLAAYKATKIESDRIILSLLKMYEARPEQTQFYEFKPFLWGRAAASYYSVRSDIQKVLWRQPKMGDVLDNLHQSTIQATITNPTSPESYDLDYFLPLFSHLLAPENPVQTYRFSKSGALALTITGLLGDKSQRFATCHVLSRFYFHLEAKQVGKDNLLWLRFVEAVCKGTALFDDLKLNNFVGVFLARTALILTQPNNVMYVPLTQYLVVKDKLNFSTIPELYTFLHSSHIDCKEHKHFILEVLRDGMRSEKDFTTFMRSMGFKLISELYASTVCDLNSRILILDIFQACCRLPLGVKVLCGSLSFLSQIFNFLIDSVHSKDKESEVVLLKLFEVLLQIVDRDVDRHRNFLIYFNLMIISEDNNNFLKGQCLNIYYQILVVIVNRFPNFFTKENMDNLVVKSGDKFCRYLVQHGCHFVKETDFSSNLVSNYLGLLFYNKLK